jgi:MoxR-like ATPase
LNHRIMLTAEREMEGTEAEDIIKEITESIEVPR